jgi:hypothetical protein
VTGTQPSVTWDEDAQRWILLERSGLSGLCLYLSSTSNALSGWEGYFLQTTVDQLENPRLGVWRDTYALAFGAVGENICAINRVQMLAATPPQAFCSASVLGPLTGFNLTRQSWTPVTVEGSASLPPITIASSNTDSLGVLFLRHHDDELHDSFDTPLFDFLEIEHWTNINFDNATFLGLNYVVSTSDFDSSGCTNGDACIQTPTTTLDAMSENVMHRASYRSGLIVGSFTSNPGNGARIRWFELIWAKPLILLAERFVLRQEGDVGGDDGNARWLPTIALDSFNNTVLAYSITNNATLYPSIAVTTRLYNDPFNGMRNETVLIDGSSLSSSTPAWGGIASLSSWPGHPREYYLTHLVANGDWEQQDVRIRMQGETIQRIWTAEDSCNQTECVQQIVAS